MKRLVWLGWAGIGLVACALAMPVSAQDLTTQLSKFLVDLRAGTLGVTQAITAIQGGDGSATAPTYSFSANSNTGFLREGSGVVDYVGNGNRTIQLAGNLTIASDAAFRFSNTAGNATATADTAISRVAAGEFGWTAVAFAALGTPANGTFCYCSDCTIANPCASGGTGAFAKRLNATWVCN